MKRKIIVLLLALCLGHALLRKSAEKPLNETQADLLQAVSGAPRDPTALASSPEVLPEQKREEEEKAITAPVVAPRLFFPEARVLASAQAEVDSRGNVHVIKTVENKQKVILIDETYEGGTLVDQIAMMANQVLAQKPDGLADERFMAILGEVGASDVKRAGESYLITFQAEPENPHALHTFMARLKMAMNGEIVVEPNYIRRLL
jgi:hypothetical protein